MEIEREGLHYELLKQVMGGRVYFAPLSNPQHILDIGTGTGQWVMEMGNFPRAALYSDALQGFMLTHLQFCSRVIPRLPGRHPTTPD